MKKFLKLLFVGLAFSVNSQYCPNLGADQLLPCGVNSTTLVADLSQCAAGINPNQTTNYSVSNIPYIAQTNSGTNLTMSDDSQQGPFNIGFNFCFFGQTYTQFYVGSNGWISFSGAQPITFTSTTIPTTNASVPKNCIMGPWQDWHPGIGGQIKYQMQGVAPCRKLVVSWIGVPMFSCTSNQGTFHIVIYETTNNIENHIQNKPPCLQWSGGTAVEGIHNTAGTVGITVPGRNSTSWTANNDAWRWSPSGPIVNPVLTWYQVGVAAPIGIGPTITVTPPLAGAEYTCHFVYPICNAGWNICNSSGGFGPDTVFVQPGTTIPVAGAISSLDTICWQSTNEIYTVPFQLGYTYNWNTIGNITSGQGTNAITIDWSNIPPGFISGAVQVIPEWNGCIGIIESVDLFILNVEPEIQLEGPFCEYDNIIILSALPIGGIFSGGGVTDPQFDPSIAVGTNTITYTYTSNGCIFDTTTQIIVYPKPTIDSITPNNIFYELCELDSYIITWSAITSPPGYNEWTWMGQTIQQNTFSDMITWDMDGMQEISITHYANGCISDPTITSITITQCPLTVYYIPNTFTPDGDGYNNVFQVIFTDGYDPFDFSMFIYNRWGEVIWESHDSSAYWNGTYNGDFIPNGIYNYVIQFGNTMDDSDTIISGHVNLIR